MRRRGGVGLSLALLFPAASLLSADPLNCTLHGIAAPQAFEVRAHGETLDISWTGEHGTHLRAAFGIDHAAPVVRELSADGVLLGRDLVPEITTVSGVRRAAHGLPDEHRWDVFWDAPLVIPGRGEAQGLPRKPEEIRRASSSFDTHSCEVRQEGARLEISFPGLSLGIFSGRLQFTAYQGSNLLRMEAIAKNDQPSVAYKYTAGLGGFSLDQLQRVTWRDAAGNPQRYEFGGTPNRDAVPLVARNRLAIAEGARGSLAVFPPPHQFFFAREIEVNSGYVWYRKNARSFSLGVRQGDTAGGYDPTWIEQVYALYNAPPGTWQRMAVYFYLAPGDAASTRDAALAYTHGDRFRPLPGYQVMATHFHTAFAEELAKTGSLDVQPPWIPAIRDLGVNIVMLDDFHGDGHARDTGRVRLEELRNYYEACQRHSDRDFLILPGEEANEYLGGHYNLLFPKPVYWTHARTAGQSFMQPDDPYGTVYHPANAGELFDMLRREDALVWQTHPRTKGSTFYPDRIREQDYFRSDQWLGAGFKAMPVDLSESRLCEKRCFSTLDDMNNWDGPKYLVGEVDTYKKFPDYDLYGDFNVNYVKLDVLPPAADWTALNRALRAGDFFVSTGEVLLGDFRVNPSGITADVEWTFPLEFVEVVWGDGERVDRKVIPTREAQAFGKQRFEIPVDLSKQKWVRFAAWDSAVNGAFTQPIFLKK
ncbi:MAG: hypothetical protein LAP39_03715 [Acidobacteriia bacterium]|nr:hypothetical protein [Terriglobia bacterium]